MIGGIDIHLWTNAGESAMELAVRTAQRYWPHATFENALVDERYDTFGEIPFAEIVELVVYRDRSVAEIWRAEGAIPSVYNTMIHLLLDDDMITIVIDEKEAEMMELIGAIESALNDEILSVPATLEAA